MGEVTLRGKILTCESRELRSGKFILTFDISDFTDTISVKMFVRPELFEEVKGVIDRRQGDGQDLSEYQAV